MRKLVGGRAKTNKTDWVGQEILLAGRWGLAQLNAKHGCRMADELMAVVYDPPEEGLPWLAVFIQGDLVRAAAFDTPDAALDFVDQGAAGMAKLGGHCKGKNEA
jgi:hypothetical protein